jgi:hypothetical protein
VSRNRVKNEEKRQNFCRKSHFFVAKATKLKKPKKKTKENPAFAGL